MDQQVATFARELSTVEVRVGIVEKSFEDYGTKQQVKDQLQALEQSLSTKIEACTLKKDSADAIAQCYQKIKKEIEEREEQQRIEEKEKKIIENEFKDSEII